MDCNQTFAKAPEVLRQMDGIALIRWAVAELFAQATAAPLAVFVALTLLWLLVLRPDDTKSTTKEKQVDHQDSAVASFLDRLGVPADVHLEGCCLPGSSLVINQKITEFENDFCFGKMIDLHRATHNKEMDKAGDYMYGHYFIGKKRLWETRVQLKFKKPPRQSDLFFGVETENYVHMSRAVQSAMDMVVRMLKSAVGNHIYHSVGDNPEDFKGSARELELPTFVMPMWAFDQFIVTPAGEEPPDLDDECIPDLGSKRVNRVAEFRKELDDLVFEVGPTYTLCFWGISQWLDKLNWQVRLPMLGRLDMNQFCGSPPVHVVMYTLAHSDHEKRHLQSRKQYILNIPFWSSKNRPKGSRVMELLGAAEACDPAYFSSRWGGLSPAVKKPTGFSKLASPFLGCCAGSRL